METKTSREYRQEAADARARAERATAPGAREHILLIAANLDKHADELEAQVGRSPGEEGRTMMETTQSARDRRTYGFLRSIGASHEVATLKVARGNWNPYTATDPTPTAERMTEVEANVADLHR